MVLNAISAFGVRLAHGIKDDRRGRSRALRTLPGKPSRRVRWPSCELLEARALMAVPSYDYELTGLNWQNPAHITYSIAPDSVFWDHGTNDLNATLNAKFGTGGTWQR